MRRLTVEHKTHYTYSEPVTFGQHRLMLRPRDSHGLRLHEARLTLSPTGDVKYIYDVFGNSIALVDFHGPGSELVIESVLELDSYSAPALEILLDPAAANYPFVYSGDDRFDASQMLTPHYEDNGEVKAWVATFVTPGETMGTLDLLHAINAAIKADFTYNARHEEGTQTPAKTLELKSGTCRDFALLFIEAVRELGFAARFVTGYLYTPHLDLSLDLSEEIRGAGSTHAWAEVYLPGAGWIDFDPTNALIGTDHLVRVAVVRDPRQASPIVGSFSGSATAFLSMDVEVFVSTRTPVALDSRSRGGPAEVKTDASEIPQEAPAMVEAQAAGGDGADGARPSARRAEPDPVG
ncbi:transglutaminase family protein [Aquabacter sp. CN5-332]|uniref:transglutaminase family protein n=1 Tax=Aquabacter sp. CN5-332 TaxID=3156608 RepID=UPI0032B55C66